MNIIEFLDKLPLWGILVTSVVMILLSTEFGFLLANGLANAPPGREKFKLPPPWAFWPSYSLSLSERWHHAITIMKNDYHSFFLFDFSFLLCFAFLPRWNDASKVRYH